MTNVHADTMQFRREFREFNPGCFLKQKITDVP